MTGTTERDELRLPARAANHVPLTPLDFLERAARVFPDRTAWIDGSRTANYREFRERVHRLASALQQSGIEAGDRVSVLAPNGFALLEAHYGVPLAGAVLNPVNTRLDPSGIAFILRHAGSKLLLVDRCFHEAVAAALDELEDAPQVVDIDVGEGEPIGDAEYESFLAKGDPNFDFRRPDDENEPIALNYTSGTTGDPKGAIYSHRGAFLNATGNVLAFLSMEQARYPIYLWSLPMFHCNGWCYPWAVTLAGGTHVCLREVDPATMFRLIDEHDVTHLCGAPIVLNMLIQTPEENRRQSTHPVEIATGGSAPPRSIVSGMEAMGFRVTHLYGLTETYGPSVVCTWQANWHELPLEERADRLARQGVQQPMVADYDIIDEESGERVARDGEHMGELVVRSNTVMRGYFKNPERTDEALADGWFRTGDLGVIHEDGYVEIKDRVKDVIISGGENISSLEVEDVLFRHPDVSEAAVVARPDDKWGETPCAFVDLLPGKSTDAAEIIDWCRERLAHFKAPKTVVFGELPKTSTGKVQKYELRERAAALSDGEG